MKRGDKIIFIGISRELKGFPKNGSLKMDHYLLTDVLTLNKTYNVVVDISKIGRLVTVENDDGIYGFYDSRFFLPLDHN